MTHLLSYECFFLLLKELIFYFYLRNRSALAVNYWVIIYCLAVSCKGDQITSAKREWFICLQFTIYLLTIHNLSAYTIYMLTMHNLSDNLSDNSQFICLQFTIYLFTIVYNSQLICLQFTIYLLTTHALELTYFDSNTKNDEKAVVSFRFLQLPAIALKES